MDIKSQQITDHVWRKDNPPILLVEVQIGAAIVENSMEVPLKTKNRINIWSSNPTTVSRKKHVIQKNTCTPTF